MRRSPRGVPGEGTAFSFMEAPSPTVLRRRMLQHTPKGGVPLPCNASFEIYMKF
jgi:hypothetical protein